MRKKPEMTSDKNEGIKAAVCGQSRFTNDSLDETKEEKKKHGSKFTRRSERTDG